MAKQPNRNLSTDQDASLLQTLESRFEKNRQRHPQLEWSAVKARLLSQPEKRWSLQQMEATSGEPDVIGYDAGTGTVLFCDCAAETPAGRRSLCYDREGWESRKEARPAGNAVDRATEMGIELLSEETYRQLQTLGSFDNKTSSWLLTPTAVRELGGALFGDRRYNRVFVYHNGAQSYYAVRGFRGQLWV